MIANKNQLKKALKERKDSLRIKRIYNYEKDNKVEIGSIGTIQHVQSNAFTIKYNEYNRDCWVYLDNQLSCEIKDNKMNYYCYVGKKFDSKMIEKLKNENIELIPLTEEEKSKVNKGTNAEYQYKFIVIQNEIMELN